MSGLWRWFGRLFIAALVAFGIAAAAAYWVASRSLPQVDGARQVLGLQDEVEVVRDAFGVPRIFGSNREDALFALGYAHAMDRLWQMDMARRLAQGRLSERLGERALATDRLMRALDLDGHAVRSLPILGAETRIALESYAAGVNARLAEIEAGEHGRGAPEFHLFSGPVDPWRPEDSISVAKTMAFEISMAALARESLRGRMLIRLEPAQVGDLFPEYPGQGIDALPPYQPPVEYEDSRRAPPQDDGLAFLGLDDPQMSGASGAWAVDGTRTAGRAPLLAADPHLPLTAPSIWYPAQMTAPGFSVIGATLPGIPAVVHGRNRAIAWGLTATQLDDLDVYIERIDPEDPKKYIAADGPRAFETRGEIVKVRGGEDVTLGLRHTHHGPVIPAGTAGLDAVTPEGHVPAIAWTALSDDDTTLDGLMALNEARSAEEALAAAGFVVAPALNLMVADRETIGMTVAGRAPLRRITAPFQGRVPAPGWTDQHDWVGWVPQRILPRVIEPESGALANANNRIGNRPFPRHLSFDWDAPYRINRIGKLINLREAHSIDSFKAMQSDNGSEMARALLPLIGSALWADEALADAPAIRRDALQRLKVWNGEMAENDPEPLIFVAWLDALTALITRDELGDLAPRYRGPRPLFLERVFKDIGGASRWCDDTGTEDREACSSMAARALDQVLTTLTNRYGTQIQGWRWGLAHRAMHRNRVFTAIAADVFGTRIGLGWIADIEQETSGGDDTLNRGAMPHSGPEPFRNVHGAGYRGVYDFSDLDRSVYIVSTGASGHPLSQFYANLAPLWRIGDYMPMSMQRRDIEAGALGTLLMQPAQ